MNEGYGHPCSETQKCTLSNRYCGYPHCHKGKTDAKIAAKQIQLDAGETFPPIPNQLKHSPPEGLDFNTLPLKPNLGDWCDFAWQVWQAAKGAK
jgi:hypothetical protein